MADVYVIHWTSVAEASFSEECQFILLKWNPEEVLRFIEAVESFIILLSKNPHMGRYFSGHDVFAFVVSRQTTVFYRIATASQIDVLFFFNNRMDPASVLKYTR